MKFGDIVSVTLDADKYGKQQALVIGSPAYSKDRAILMVASPSFAGMPINRSWCELFSEGHIEEARCLRDAYEAKYPNFLLQELLLDESEAPPRPGAPGSYLELRDRISALLADAEQPATTTGCRQP